MKNKTIIILVVAGVLALCGVGCVGTVLGFRTDCVQSEAGIEAQYKANQASYDTMWKTFREMAQVPAMYEAHLKDVWAGVISGRYNDNGRLLLAVKEDNPKLDPSMYTKIQAAIESNRTRFNQDQTELVDKKRQYEVILRGNTALVVNGFLGFPKIDLSKYDIVTSDETQKAFDEKKAGEIKLQ